MVSLFSFFPISNPLSVLLSKYIPSLTTSHSPVVTSLVKAICISLLDYCSGSSADMDCRPPVLHFYSPASTPSQNGYQATSLSCLRPSSGFLLLPSLKFKFLTIATRSHVTWFLSISLISFLSTVLLCFVTHWSSLCTLNLWNGLPRPLSLLFLLFPLP